MADIKKLQEKHRDYLISKGLDNPELLTWHGKRRAGLGGSDIGAILGVNPYKSAYDLFIDKTNPVSDNNGNLRTQFGHDFEHVIAEKFSLNYPQYEVQVDTTHYIHPEYLWLNGNIDRKLINRDTKECGVLEIKTTRTFDSEDWGKGTVYGIGGKVVISDDKVPESYYYQVQHYLCVTGFKFAYLYAFALDTCEYRLYTIDRDETKIKLLIKIGTEFWFNNVIKGVEPEHTITPDKQISTATAIKATEDVFKLVQALKDVKIQIKALEIVEDNLSAKIKEFMQQNEILNDSDGKKLLSYKTSYRRDFDKSAFESDNPELYNEYLTDKPIRSLRLATTKKEK